MAAPHRVDQASPKPDAKEPGAQANAVGRPKPAENAAPGDTLTPYPPARACTGPAPCGGADPCPDHHERVVRGGSWYWFADHANGVDRRSHFPADEPSHHDGFRCAASVAEADALTAPAAPAPP